MEREQRDPTQIRRRHMIRMMDGRHSLLLGRWRVGKDEMYVKQIQLLIPFTYYFFLLSVGLCVHVWEYVAILVTIF